MVVQLTILVGNAPDLAGLGYTRIEVWQSIDQGNSFQEVTGPVAAAAVLDSSVAQTTFQMGGRLLKFVIDGGSEVSVDFSDIVSLWTPLQVVNRINEVAAGRASLVGGNQVRLTSPTTGRASSVLVTYSDSPDLGWSADEVVYGLAARVILSGGTRIYSFPDVAGTPDDRYKWRFSANGSNPVSEFSAEVSGQVAPVIDSSNMSVGTAQFYDAMGNPAKTDILIGIDSSPQAIAGGSVSVGSAMKVTSDDTGFLQVTLVRGLKVRIGIIGTSYVREFVVPNATNFDLLAVMATAPDPYTVQITPPQLIRRSM